MKDNIQYFRVWDKEEERFLYWDTESYRNLYDSPKFGKVAMSREIYMSNRRAFSDIMMYSGIDDINGKMIFEEDCIITDGKERNVSRIVEYTDGVFNIGLDFPLYKVKNPFVFLNSFESAKVPYELAVIEREEIIKGDL